MIKATYVPPPTLIFAGRCGFVLNGMPITAASRPEDFADRTSGSLACFSGHPKWALFRTRGLPINASLSFKDDQLQGGYFWASVEGGSWDTLEKTEGYRRLMHEQIMQDLFGANKFENDILHVDLVRDPRSSMEEIAFRIIA